MRIDRASFPGFVLILFVLTEGAAAQFTPRQAGPTPITVDDAAVIGWDWGFTLDRNEIATGFGAPNWRLIPSSPAAAAGQTRKFLSLSLQHLVRPARAGHGLEPVPNTPADVNLQFAFFRMQIPRISTLAFVQQHGNGGHADIYDLRVREPGQDGSDGSLTLDARHMAGQTATWSFTPRRRAGAYIVTASYSTDPLERQDRPANSSRPSTEFGATSGKQEGRLGNSTPNRQRPTDWILEVAYNPRSVTTLAWVVLTADGRFDKAELGMMTRFYLDRAEYLVPVLLDSQGNDLHIAVNLTEWVTSGTTFEQDDDIEIAGGGTDRLPRHPRLDLTGPVRRGGRLRSGRSVHGNRHRERYHRRRHDRRNARAASARRAGRGPARHRRIRVPETADAARGIVNGWPAAPLMQPGDRAPVQCAVLRMSSHDAGTGAARVPSSGLT